MSTFNASEVISADENHALFVSLTSIASASLFVCFLATASKAFRFVIPIAWKCCLCLQDIACVALCIGLVLVSAFTNGVGDVACKAAGFFLLFGLLDLLFSVAFMGITLVFIQNPSKMSQLSTFRWCVFLGIVIPEKIIVIVLSTMPVLPIDYFDTTSPYPLACFPIRQEGDKGAAFGAIVFFTMWGLLAIGLVLAIVNAVRFWTGPSTRIHASSPSLWQMQKMEQGRTLHKFSLLELVIIVVVMFVVTIVVYTNSYDQHTPQWMTLLSLAAVAVVHGVVAFIEVVLWSGICCDTTAQKKEPHHRLKQLELVRIEGPGKLRLKASWTAGKGVWRRGLLKVYGPAHIKGWAQEIVVLGLLRKSQSASVLQCLWTSNTNPYYEAMTLISGDIVTSDSRLTCLEMTSSGTLQELLKSMEVPLPEPCQKTIMHDVAEGLSYLHDQNVLHRNLTSAAVYLKGSVHCFVLRAAVGDFEDAQIYGTLLTGSPTSTISRKRFFLPDIRAYALVGLEMLGRVCECRQREKQPHRKMAPKVLSNLKDDMGMRKHHKHSKDFQLHHNHHRPSHHRNMLPTSAATQGIGSTRFISPEVPYCAPGEAEYATPLDFPVIDEEPFGSSSERNEMEFNQVKSKDVRHSRVAENDIDENWKLRAKTASKTDAVEPSDERGFSWQEFKSYEDRYKHSQVPGVTNVKEMHQYEFPDHSVFKTTHDGEELDMIEEEIERGQPVHFVKNGVYKQAGYVTSRTEDGREIFIPAAYKTKKSSGNSSSGYGSASDYGVPGPSHSEFRQVHKTSSAATVSSFGGDDVLEVLPGMTDVEEHRPKKGELMLKELMKAKHDAKIEQLIESYEDRVRRGELGSNQEGIPIGVVFPKKNRQQQQQQQQQATSQMVISTAYKGESGPEIPESSLDQPKGKLSSPRPKTAHASMTERLQRAGPSRPMTAGSSSFNAWNARSSMKRSKARTALKKALSLKGPSVPNKLDYDHMRGKSAKDVEMKYASRPSTAMSMNSDFLTSDHDNMTLLNDIPTQELDSQTPRAIEIEVAPKHDTDINTSQPPSSSINIESSSATDAKIKPAVPKKPNVARKPSAKSKPAPQPPPVPPKKPVVPVSPIRGKDSNVEQRTDPEPTSHKRVSSPPPSGTPVPKEHYRVVSPVPRSTTPTPRDRHRVASPTPITTPRDRQRVTSPIPKGTPILNDHHRVASPIPRGPFDHRSTKPISARSTTPLPKSPRKDVTTHTGLQQMSSHTSSLPLTSEPQMGSPPRPRTPAPVNESFTSTEPASSTTGSDNTTSSSGIVHHDDEPDAIDKIQSEMNNIIQQSDPAAVAASVQAHGPGLPSGIRLIDSGFDSTSVTSEEDEECLCAAAALQAAEDGSCSCPSEIFSQGSCSCACSNCLSVAQGNNQSWTGSQDSETWSNSNSFSSYEANMYRRKLPNKRNEPLGCVLAPDEQYPSPVHHHPHHHHPQHGVHIRGVYSPKRNRRHLRHTKGNYPSSPSETSSAASRRYRELVKKGVPMRVSVIGGDVDGHPQDETTQPQQVSEQLPSPEQDNLTRQHSADGLDEHSALVKNLESQGFFDKNSSSMPSFQNNLYNDWDDDDEDDRYQELSPIPSLEEIIKEIPDETGNYSEEAKAFLNRPESELSVKALQAVLSRHGSATENQMSSKELIIDRIFSYNAPHDFTSSSGSIGMHGGGLDLDEDAIREVAMLPGSSMADESIPSDLVGLLAGMDGRHVRYCQNISSRVNLINMSELLPASPQAFDQLKSKLKLSGNFGVIGSQILDLLRMCWLNESPPTTAAIVDQLTDHVTETEL